MEWLHRSILVLLKSKSVDSLYGEKFQTARFYGSFLRSLNQFVFVWEGAAGAWAIPLHVWEEFAKRQGGVYEIPVYKYKMSESWIG